jgi:hypothetical protein
MSDDNDSGPKISVVKPRSSDRKEKRRLSNLATEIPVENNPVEETAVDSVKVDIYNDRKKTLKKNYTENDLTELPDYISMTRKPPKVLPEEIDTDIPEKDPIESIERDIANLKRAVSIHKIFFLSIYLICTLIMYICPLACVVSPLLEEKYRNYLVCTVSILFLAARIVTQCLHPKRRYTTNDLVKSQINDILILSINIRIWLFVCARSCLINPTTIFLVVIFSFVHFSFIFAGNTLTTYPFKN